MNRDAAGARHEECTTHNGPNIRLGPHRPPRIACGKCGTKHHYDAAHGEHIGRCPECSGYLRRPTEAEHEQFTEFLVWNSAHYERENNIGEYND